MHTSSKKMTPANVANVAGAAVMALGDAIREATVASEREQAATVALVQLSKYPGSSVDSLRGPLGLTHSGCVRLVDRLAASGHVERRAGAEDGRAVALHLTRKGQGAAQRALRARATALEEALSVLTAAEQETLGRLAARLITGRVTSESRALRTCRLCDYQACVACPVQALAASGALDSTTAEPPAIDP
jgi:DNA-binding MarR family transcriptional regulator